MQFSMFGNLQILIKWKYSVDILRHIIPRLWAFDEIRSYYETQIIRIVWVMENMGIRNGMRIL